MNRCLAGLRDHLARSSKLDPPKKVLDATAEVGQEQDKVGRFCDEVLVAEPGNIVPFKDMFSLFGAWCDENDVRKTSSKSFSRAMKRLLTKQRRRVPVSREDSGPG